MFSPMDDDAVKAWFRLLDAAWKRMPAEERTRQREEVQQHLEGLAAANTAQGQPLDAAWNAALVQFGDPAKIGRKIQDEWRQSRTGFRAEMAAIGFGVCFQLALRLLGALLIITSIPGIVYFVLYLIGCLIQPVLIGRKYPKQAIKAMFYTSFLWSLWLVVMYHTSPTFLAKVFVGVGFQVLLAYLASVTKRGWYRPGLEDFKIALPKRLRG